jgi:hypothetical protein
MWPASPTPDLRQGTPRTHTRNCGSQPAHQSLITDVYRSRLLPCAPTIKATADRGERNAPATLKADIRDVLQAHGEVEPIRDGRARDTGRGQNGTQARAAVGERGQFGVAVPAQGIESASDQRRDVGAGSRNSTEHLPAALGCLGIADAHLQVPLPLVAAADKGRVQAEGDFRHWRHRLDRGRIAQLLTDRERAAAQGLVARRGRDRQQMGQHASGDAVSHQRGQARLQLVQRRGGAAVRGPADARFGSTTARATEPR